MSTGASAELSKFPGKTGSELLAEENDTAEEAAIDPATGKMNPATLIAEDDSALEQVRRNYFSSRRSVVGICIAHLVITAAAISAFLYYLPGYDYYGYASMSTSMPPPGECCNCAFPAWKQFIMGVFLALSVASCLYTIWTVGEAPRANIRLHIFTGAIQWIIIAIYMLIILVLAVAIFWCNGPYTFFNPCNDKNWDCAYDVNGTHCHDFPALGVPMIPQLKMNNAFLVFFTYSFVSLIFYIITMIVMEAYGTHKISYSTHVLKDPLRTVARSYRELSSLAIIQILLIFFFMSVIVGSVIYLLYWYPTSDLPTLMYYTMPSIDPPGTFVDESFGSKWIIYLIWAVTGIVFPIAILSAVFPTTDGNSKITATVATVVWAIKDFIFGIVLIILFAFCNTGTIPDNPCANDSDPTLASPLFRVISIATAIEFVLEILIFALFIVMRKLIVRLKIYEGGIRQHVVMTARTLPDYKRETPGSDEPASIYSVNQQHVIHKTSSL